MVLCYFCEISVLTILISRIAAHSSRSNLLVTRFHFVYVQSVELTEKAVDFLKGVFVDFDTDMVSMDKMTKSGLKIHSLLNGLRTAYYRILRTTVILSWYCFPKVLHSA